MSDPSIQSHLEAFFGSLYKAIHAHALISEETATTLVCEFKIARFVPNAVQKDLEAIHPIVSENILKQDPWKSGIQFVGQRPAMKCKIQKCNTK